MKLFCIKPENEFWEKTEFFSESKQSAVNDDNLNDLYNTQDVILLTEIIESPFEAMKILMVLIQENAIQLVR